MSHEAWPASQPRASLSLSSNCLVILMKSEDELQHHSILLKIYYHPILTCEKDMASYFCLFINACWVQPMHQEHFSNDGGAGSARPVSFGSDKMF